MVTTSLSTTPPPAPPNSPSNSSIPPTGTIHQAEGSGSVVSGFSEASTFAAASRSASPVNLNPAPSTAGISLTLAVDKISSELGADIANFGDLLKQTGPEVQAKLREFILDPTLTDASKLLWPFTEIEAAAKEGNEFAQKLCAEILCKVPTYTELELDASAIAAKIEFYADEGWEGVNEVYNEALKEADHACHYVSRALNSAVIETEADLKQVYQVCNHANGEGVKRAFQNFTKDLDSAITSMEHGFEAWWHRITH